MNFFKVGTLYRVGAFDTMGEGVTGVLLIPFSVLLSGNNSRILAVMEPASI